MHILLKTLRAVRMSHLLPFVSTTTLPLHIDDANETNLYALPLIQKDPDAIVVIMDLSGYTTITRQLMEQAEKYQNTDSSGSSINASQYVGKLITFCLDPLMDLVLDYGGDVVKYGGDALFCLWQSSSKFNTDGTSLMLQDRIMNAVKCCIAATRQVRLNPLLDFENKVIPLALHCVVHWGAVEILHVGDQDRKESVCYGAEYLHACSLLEKAEKDEIVLSHGTMLLLEKHTIPLITKKQRNGDYWVLHVDSKTAFLDAELDISLAQSRQTQFKGYLETQSNPLEQLSAFVDSSVKIRQNGTSSMSPEIRLATVVFLRLIRNDQNGDTNTLSWPLNELFNAAEQACHPLEADAPLGILRQLAVDDKGLSLLLLFGLPPSASENPSVSAACVALKVMSTLAVQRLPFKAACGIATGRIFSGVISSSNRYRMEHAVLGNAVNLAARFMMLKQAENSIICDRATREMLSTASKLVRTTAMLEPINQVKGWKDPLDAFLVHDNTGISNLSIESVEQTTHQKYVQVDFHDANEDDVWKNIFDALDKRRHFGAPSFAVNHLVIETNTSRRTSTISNRMSSFIHSFVIEGPSGAGKSTTARRICDYAKSKKYSIWEIQTFEIEQSTAFSCVRQLINVLVREVTKNNYFRSELERSRETLSGSEDILDQIATVLTIPRRHATTIRNLQNFVMSKITAASVQGSTVPNTNGQAMNSPDTIFNSASEAIISIINALSKVVNIVIVFDDCQWLDRYSWSLTAAIHTQCRETALVIISRPPKEYRDPSLCAIYQAIVKSSLTYANSVGKVTSTRTRDIVTALFSKSQFSADQLEKVSQRLFDLSSGNAFALDVLLRHMQNSMIHDEKMKMDLDPLKVLPNDTRAVFVSQLSSLHPTFQSIIRKAALIGQVFYLMDVMLLCKVQEVEFDQWTRNILEWDTFDFVEELDNGRWRFKHCLISYQIYSILPLDERLASQKEMAAYFEQVIAQPQGKNRKSELRKLLHELYLALNDKDNTFLYACKLVSMYHKMAMHSSCREMLIQVMSDKKRFANSPMRDKLNLIAVQCGFYLSDNALCIPCLRPFAQAYAGITLKKCTLFLTFQFLDIISKLDKLWRNVEKTGQWPEQSSSNYLNNNNISVHRQMQFIRTICRANESSGNMEHTLLTYTAKMNVNYNLSLQGRSFSQWIDNLVYICGFMMMFGKSKSAFFLAHYLGMEQLTSDSPIIQRIQEFEKLSVEQFDEFLLPLAGFMSTLGPYYGIFRAHFGRGHRLADRVWSIVSEFDNMQLKNAVMNTYQLVFLNRLDRPMRQDYPLTEFIRSIRFQCERQPSYVPDRTVAVYQICNYSSVCFQIRDMIENPEDYERYLDQCPEFQVDENDVEFVTEYIVKNCNLSIQLEKDQFLNNVALNRAMTQICMLRKEAATSVKYFERYLNELATSKGVMRLCFYATFCSPTIGHLVDFGYFMLDIYSKEQRKALLELFRKFFKIQVNLSLSAKKQWSVCYLAKQSYYQGNAILKVLSCKTPNDCRACLPALQEALSIAESVENNLGQKYFLELILFMQAGLLPFESMQPPLLDKETLIRSRSIYKKCIELYKELSYHGNRVLLSDANIGALFRTKNSTHSIYLRKDTR